MIQPVQELLNFLSSLPVAQQTEIAQSLLEEAKWEASLKSAKGKAFVDNLIAEVEEEIKAGTTIPLEEWLEKVEPVIFDNRTSC